MKNRFLKIFGLKIKEDGYQFEVVNYIAKQMEKMFEECLEKEINRFRRKGLIFVCKKDEFHRYDEDFARMLKNIGFYSTFQEVNIQKIDEDLRTKLKEQLPESVEIVTDGNIESKLLTTIFELRTQISKNIKISFQQANTLQGLIENYLKQVSPSLLPQFIRSSISANLMIIITNADSCKTSKLNSVVKEIFNSKTNAGQKAGLTLVSFLNTNSEPSINPSSLADSSSWYLFNPLEEVKDKGDTIWERLENQERNLFDSNQVLKAIIIRSNGSGGMLRENWFKSWTKINQEGRNTILIDDL